MKFDQGATGEHLEMEPGKALRRSTHAAVDVDGTRGSGYQEPLGEEALIEVSTTYAPTLILLLVLGSHDHSRLSHLHLLSVQSLLVGWEGAMGWCAGALAATSPSRSLLGNPEVPEST